MADGPVRALLVEDDEDDYLLTRDLFEQLPQGAYHLDRVATYEAALEAFAKCQHDVYLLDYRLGERTGIDLIIEAARLGCHSPIIMITGQREREVDLLATKTGAVDYLVKDELTVTSLERSMRYALQQRRHQDAIRQVNQHLERRVQERTAELAKLNEALRVEVTERKRVEEQLRLADRKKDEFLATLAHELRNPLSPLTAAVQLIGLEPENVSHVRELAAVMARQLGQLVRLIDDLLDVSRISGGKLQLRKTHVSLGEPIAAALDVSRPIIESARHALQVSLPPELMVLEGDQVRLTQIISNLLINAAKYTPPGGTIQLSVQAEGEQVVIRVRDTGVGIPPEMQSRIFDLFTQVDSSQTRTQGGLGIGLTLVKTLVEMHGGNVSVSSPGPGAGSEFTVRLPLAAAATSNRAAPRSATLPENTGQPRGAYRVLVVDDSESAAHLLARLLKRLGQEVRVAHSAEEALSIVNDFQPQLVISDIGMPGMSGLELAQRLRALPDLPQPLLVALTGYGQESDRRQVLGAGFDKHLTKPIGLAALEELLAQLRA
jgi:signal transduction histidine kinase